MSLWLWDLSIRIHLSIAPPSRNHQWVSALNADTGGVVQGVEHRSKAEMEAPSPPPVSVSPSPVVLTLLLKDLVLPFNTTYVACSKGGNNRWRHKPANIS